MGSPPGELRSEAVLRWAKALGICAGIGLGACIIGYQAFFVPDPNLAVMGFGAFILGFPAALGFDFSKGRDKG